MTGPTQGPGQKSAQSAVDGSIVAPRPTGQDTRPGSGLRFRHSVAARISALVVVVLIAAGASAVVAVTQLRALQRGFDRLVEVYVVFNRGLAEANVQAARVGAYVETWQREPTLLEPTFEVDFHEALMTRNEYIEKAREPIDDALVDPDRLGGAEPLEELRALRRALEELQTLAELPATLDTREILADVRTQTQIEQSFKDLGNDSRAAIERLRREVQDAQDRAEGLTLALTFVVSALGVLASIGVFLTLRPLRRLTEGVRKLGRGDWSQRVSPSGPGREDEVSQLAREFNHMAAALEERERRLLRGERLAAAGQLAAQITHEIRNPLSSVALNAELLEDELSQASPESRHLLARISKEVDRLTAITEDYLSFARRPKPDLRRFDLGEEIGDLLEFMAQELEMAGVEIETQLPSTAMPVEGDSNQLRQVFMNLVRNAHQAAIDEERDPERQP
ncbi:MAG: HAMP domain-containing histidine kinase, partial [Deltaproteobacteria bacterium]|nr:HAMP domain-containing histidine kinase [Deltaproteobacteria bacterium]